MIKQIIDNKWLEARGVIAFYPANTIDHDDIELYTDEGKSSVAATLHTLRQQLGWGEGDH
jgi:5-methyltetrahydrofolate--homocysteine methyltransferase